MTPDAVAIRDYFEALIQANDKRYEQRFADNNIAINAALVAQEKAVGAALTAANAAVTKAEIAAERRFEGQNEFRAQLTDQAATFMRRSEVEQIVKALTDKSDDRLVGVQSKLDTLNALIGSAMPRGEYEANHKELRGKVEQLERNDRLRTGRSTGIDATKAFVFSLIIAAAGLIGIFYTLRGK